MNEQVLLGTLRGLKTGQRVRFTLRVDTPEHIAQAIAGSNGHLFIIRPSDQERLNEIGRTGKPITITPELRTTQTNWYWFVRLTGDSLQGCEAL